MSEVHLSPTLAEREQQLAALRQAHADTLAAIEATEAALATAEGPLAEAQRIYDAARGEVGQALAALAPPDPTATWRDKSAADAQRESDRLREAEAAFQQADRELGERLVRRNEVDRRRSELRLHARAVEARIAQAEADLDKARRAEVPDRDLLASIRARLGVGGPGLPAA